MSSVDLTVVDSSAEASAACVVCGQPIPAGGGVTARFGDRILRFKCPACLSRFRADPERYLSGPPASCCDDEHDHAAHLGPEAVEDPFVGPRRQSLRVIN